MSGELAGALATLAGALLVWPAPGSSPRTRLRLLHPGTFDPPAAPARVARRRWLLAASTGAAAGLLVGGAAGLAAGVVATAAAERLLRLAGDRGAAVGPALLRELPIACGLLAVCLAAGLPVGAALAAVGTAVPGPLGAQLGRVAGLYRLGAEPRRAWADVPGELAALGRVAVRAGESGSAILPALRSLAADGRAAERAATEAAVRRAGVWVLAPLGLCFLPAFACLGVAPLVLGIARGLRLSRPQSRALSTDPAETWDGPRSVGRVGSRPHDSGPRPREDTVMEHEEAGPVTQEPPAPPHATGLLAGVGRRWARVRATGEAGMSTAEYAVGTVAACAFAAVLYKVVTGGSIVTALTHLIDSALSTLS